MRGGRRGGVRLPRLTRCYTGPVIEGTGCERPRSAFQVEGPIRQESTAQAGAGGRFPGNASLIKVLTAPSPLQSSPTTCLGVTPHAPSHC